MWHSQTALPFAGQLVWTISGRQLAGLSKELDRGHEVFDILAAALLSLDVALELFPLGDSPH
jgi:hypothetical protein